MLSVLDSPFYRVAAKALVIDETGRLLVLRTSDGCWELPGGGWEHDESFDECLRREILEELGAGVVSIGPVAFIYIGTHKTMGFKMMRIAVPVILESFEFTCGDDMDSFKFVDQEEFIGMDFVTNEGDIVAYAHLIWPK